MKISWKIFFGIILSSGLVLLTIFQACAPFDNFEETSVDSVFHASALPSKAPNIVFIMIDDGGYADFTNPQINTPTFNKLEKKATKFTHFYTNPTCSPTRISLMTGRNPAHYGVEHAVCLPDSLVKDGTARGIPSRANSLPEVLKNMGYRTNHVGKWHLGERVGKRPIDQGYHETVVYKYNFHTFWSPIIYHYLEKKPQPLLSYKDQHKTDVLTNLTLELLEKHSSQFPAKKLFLNLWYNAPHHPYQPDDKWKKLYLNKGYTTEQEKYYGMISQVDFNIGRVISAIESDPVLSKNTLILVTSDNGGAAKDTGTNYSNAPLRGSKGKVFEGGIRVPLYAYWVGKTPKAVKNSTPLRSSDIISTFVELAGGTYTSVTEGESFADLILNQTATKRSRGKPMFWHQREQLKFCGAKSDFISKGYWKEDPYRQAARNGQWKFIAEHESGEFKEYLFDFSKTESEANSENLINSNPTKANEMRNLMDDMAVKKSALTETLNKLEGSSSGSEGSFNFVAPGGRVELAANDLYESHDGSFTYAIKVRPSSSAIGKVGMLAQREGSWALRLMANGQLQLTIIDEATGNLVQLRGSTVLQANKDYNIAFTVSGHVGSSKVEKNGDCMESTYINNVVRLFAYPTSTAEVPDPEDTNPEDIENVAFSGYDNPVRLGNSFHNNQPFFGQIHLKGAHSLALNKRQLKRIFK